MIDGRMSSEHIGGSSFDSPADPGLGEGPLERHGRGHAVENVTDGRELDNDDRTGSGHCGTQGLVGT